jgi:hypothetical protein
MHDRYDAELWNANHDQFSQWIEEGLVAAGRTVRRGLAAIEPAAGQLMAVTTALALTTITFSAAAV